VLKELFIIVFQHFCKNGYLSSDLCYFNKKDMLYIVPTPIGNLEDISYRAIRILSTVDYILAEDTRTSKPLLQHYQIETPLRSHHIHNEHRAIPAILTDLHSGKDLALISDAGTPAISDPGFLLVRACIDADIAISCLPGATAFVPALVMAGLPCNQFHFEGFLPHKKGRQTRLKLLAELPTTFALYESPHRVLKCIKQLIEHCGLERKAVVLREISKKFEDKIRGNLAEIALFLENHPSKQKGEIVIVVEGMKTKKKTIVKKYEKEEKRT